MTSAPVASANTATGVHSGSRGPSSACPLKILHVIDSAGVYGAEKVLLSLAAESTRRGHEVVVGTIVSPSDRNDPLGDAVAGQGLHHVRFRMRDGLNIGGLQQIIRFARERSVDVIHSHGYKANILLACAPQSSRRWALTCTLHGWTSRGRPDMQRIYEALERRLICRFDRVVAVSNKIAAQVRRTSLAGRLTVVPNGVEIEEHGPSQDLRRTASPSEVGQAELLAVGRLGAEKGFDMLIAAMCILRDCGVAARLRIAGEGPERPKLEAQIAAHSLGGIVELLGYQSGLSPLYRAADFFVLSSRTEGLPIVLLEAMAYGTPVVASAVGEVPTVLDDGKCGWLIEHPSADDIARTLSQAIVADSGERQGRVCRARERVDTTYSAVIMTNRYLAVYLQALADRRVVGKGRLR